MKEKADPPKVGVEEVLVTPKGLIVGVEVTSPPGDPPKTDGELDAIPEPVFMPCSVDLKENPPVFADAKPLPVLELKAPPELNPPPNPVDELPPKPPPNFDG